MNQDQSDRWSALDEDGRSEYTDMGPGALPSGEIEHRAAFSLLSQGRAPVSKGRSARAGIPPRVEIGAEMFPARVEIARGDVSRGLEISRWSLVDRLGGIDGSSVKAVKAGAR